MVDKKTEDGAKWYCMRDLKRPNAKERAYQVLEKAGYEVFTPMKVEDRVVGGKKIRIMAGPMAGYEGQLLSVKGARKRRIIVEIPGCLAVAVGVSPKDIEILKD